MTEEIQEKRGVFVPPANSHFSYVLTITFSQPTIRIKIPKVLFKALQRKNQARTENGENGGSQTMKKYRVTCKKSFRKKVGSILSNVFGKKKGENGEVHINGDDEDDEDDQMKTLKNMIERLDMESEEITRKSSAEDKGKINNVDDSIVGGDTDSNVGCVGDNGANAFGFLKQAKNSKTLTSRRKLRTAWPMKKTTSVLVRRKSSGKQELCKKRILLGGKCRPLNQSGIIQYDENGVLMPEIIS